MKSNKGQGQGRKSGNNCGRSPRKDGSGQGQNRRGVCDGSGRGNRPSRNRTKQND